MSKPHSKRMAMKSLYCANKILEMAIKANEPNAFWRIPYLMLAHQERERLRLIPWQVFCATKPKIDKRRSKRLNKGRVNK